MPRPKKLLTTADVSGRYLVHPRTVRRWILRGRLKALRVGGHWRIEEADLEDFLVRGRFQDVPPGAGGA